jgi:hypothetical protein
MDTPAGHAARSRQPTLNLPATRNPATGAAPAVQLTAASRATSRYRTTARPSVVMLPASALAKYLRLARHSDRLGDFLLFRHPRAQTLPEELLVVLRGRRHPHIKAYWDGLAYIVL